MEVPSEVARNLECIPLVVGGVEQECEVLPRPLVVGAGNLMGKTSRSFNLVFGDTWSLKTIVLVPNARHGAVD